MTTRIRNQIKGVASTAAAGLLAVLSMTAATTQASAGTLDSVSWLGQIEVTAPLTRFVAQQAKAAVANLGEMTVTAARQVSVANLGSMTVTASRLTTVAQRPTPVSSTGETASSRSRPPRAVLVQ